jgi:hypothetical protein
MNLTARLNTKKHTKQIVFGLNPALVFANEEKVSLKPPNSVASETTIAYISQKPKYRVSLKTIKQRTIQLLTPFMASINYGITRHEWRLVEC